MPKRPGLVGPRPGPSTLGPLTARAPATTPPGVSRTLLRPFAPRPISGFITSIKARGSMAKKRSRLLGFRASTSCHPVNSDPLHDPPGAIETADIRVGPGPPGAA